jgi:hypothetical protein
MNINEKEILSKFTRDDKLSNEIIENHDRLFHKIKKHKEFDLEKILIELPYIEKLKKYHIENIEILELNRLNPDLIFMTTYLIFRSELGKLMTLNNLTQPVIDKVNTLFIDIFPNEVPEMLINGLFLQSKKSVLFDNVNRIVIYKEKYNEKDGFRIFLFYTNGSFSNASLAYSSILGKSMDEIDRLELKGKFRNTDATLFRKALLFCLIFSILIKSENTPITIKDTNKSENIKKNQSKIEKKSIEGWIEKTIYINKKYKSENKLVKGTLYKDDKILKQVIVSAYLRRKPHSKDNYIYIDSFTSTRWVIEGNKKITYYLE